MPAAEQAEDTLRGHRAKQIPLPQGDGTHPAACRTAYRPRPGRFCIHRAPGTDTRHAEADYRLHAGEHARSGAAHH